MEDAMAVHERSQTGLYLIRSSALETSPVIGFPLPDSLQAIAADTVNKMRTVGSHRLLQEHLFLTLSEHPKLADVFTNNGIGTLALEQRFDVPAGGAFFSGSYEVDTEVRDIFKTASNPKKDWPGDEFELTRAAFSHPSRRLIFYLRLAGGLDPRHPGRFLAELREAEIKHRSPAPPPNRIA